MNTVSSRPTPTPQRTSSRSRDQRRNNQIPEGNRRRVYNEINPPEVLATQDSRLRRKKQYNKSKERSIPKISGNVDLGMKSLRRLKMSSTTTTTTTTTNQHANDIPRIFETQKPPSSSSNHHRHNHYNTEYDRNDYYRRMMMTSTTTQYPRTYHLPTSAPVTSTSKAYTTTSTRRPPYYPPSTTNSPALSSRHVEKVRKICKG